MQQSLNALLGVNELIADFHVKQEQIDNFQKNNKKLRRKSPIVQLKTRLRQLYFPEQSESEALEILEKEKEQVWKKYPKLHALLYYALKADESIDRVTVSAALENILGLPEDYSFSAPRAFEILQQMSAQNSYGGWFHNPTDEEVFLFQNLVQRCRKIAVLFEKNNSPDDHLALDYAYKILVLFYDPQRKVDKETRCREICQATDSFLAAKGKIGHIYHDTFLVGLENLPEKSSLADIAGWRNFLKTSPQKAKALSYFCSAVAMEEKIGEMEKKNSGARHRAPKDAKEAEKIAALCAYKRASDDPDFATLCKKYQVSEETFNSCLNYMQNDQKANIKNGWQQSFAGWPKKEVDSDQIPNVPVAWHGNKRERLYWVKLRADDKRGLILGAITDCCQSIEGDSESCVRDACERSDNALYVLVKPKNNTVPAPEGLFSESDYKIVAQSYVWRSRIGNICLDSVESLKGEIAPEILRTILEEFGQKVIEQCPDVCYVHLGRGGKTPKNIFTQTPLVERMRQGKQYYDSDTQYALAQGPSAVSTEIVQGFQPEIWPYLDYLMSVFKDQEGLAVALGRLKDDFPEYSVQEKALKSFQSFLATHGSDVVSLEMLCPVSETPTLWQSYPSTQIAIHVEQKNLALLIEHGTLEQLKYYIECHSSRKYFFNNLQVPQLANNPACQERILYYYTRSIELTGSIIFSISTQPELFRDIMTQLEPEERLKYLFKNNIHLQQVSKIHEIWAGPQSRKLLSRSNYLFLERHKELLRGLDLFFEDRLFVQKMEAFVISHVLENFYTAIVRLASLTVNLPGQVSLDVLEPELHQNSASVIQRLYAIKTYTDLQEIIKDHPEQEKKILSTVFCMEPQLFLEYVYKNNLTEERLPIERDTPYLSQILQETFFKIKDSSSEQIEFFLKHYPQLNELLCSEIIEPYITTLVDGLEKEDVAQEVVYLIERIGYKSPEKMDFLGEILNRAIDSSPKEQPKLSSCVFSLIEKYDTTFRGSFTAYSMHKKEFTPKVAQTYIESYNSLIKKMSINQFENFVICYQRLNGNFLSCHKDFASLQEAFNGKKEFLDCFLSNMSSARHLHGYLHKAQTLNECQAFLSYMPIRVLLSKIIQIKEHASDFLEHIDSKEYLSHWLISISAQSYELICSCKFDGEPHGEGLHTLLLGLFKNNMLWDMVKNDTSDTVSSAVETLWAPTTEYKIDISSELQQQYKQRMEALSLDEKESLYQRACSMCLAFNLKEPDPDFLHYIAHNRSDLLDIFCRNVTVLQGLEPIVSFLSSENIQQALESSQLYSRISNRSEITSALMIELNALLKNLKEEQSDIVIKYMMKSERFFEFLENPLFNDKFEDYCSRIKPVFRQEFRENYKNFLNLKGQIMDAGEFYKKHPILSEYVDDDKMRQSIVVQSIFSGASQKNIPGQAKPK